MFIHFLVIVDSRFIRCTDLFLAFTKSDAKRSSDGGLITFNFAPGAFTPGKSSDLVIQTDAASFNVGGALTSGTMSMMVGSAYEPSSVPEPSSILLMGVSLVIGLVFLPRRRSAPPW